MVYTVTEKSYRDVLIAAASAETLLVQHFRDYYRGRIDKLQRIHALAREIHELKEEQGEQDTLKNIKLGVMGILTFEHKRGRRIFRFNIDLETGNILSLPAQAASSQEKDDALLLAATAGILLDLDKQIIRLEGELAALKALRIV